MSSSYDINTAFDALDDSLVSDVVDLDSWTSSLSPHVTSDEPVRHPSASHRPKRTLRSRGHPRPTPSVTISPATRSFPAPPVLSTPVVASSSTKSGASGKVDKGKGREPATTPTPTASPMDSSPLPTSGDLTPEQHVCIMRMLKRLDEWISRGWEPGVDESRLRHLAEIFNSAETIASGGIENIRQADLAWKLADSREWESSAASSIMGAIDIQVTVTRIVYKDYGDTLIHSFRSFLGRKEAESFRRGFDSKTWTAQMEDLATFAQKGMREADYLLTRRVPAFRRMMKRARLLPNTSRLLEQRLMAGGEISSFRSESPLPVLTPSGPSTPLLCSLTRRLSHSSSTPNSDTSLPAEELLPTPILWEAIDVSDVIPSDTGHPTMTSIVETFMEDLLTQEFSPVLLDEDI